MRARTHTDASALAGARSSTVSTMMDECNGWWMSEIVWLQQSKCLDECNDMISAELMLRHECSGRVCQWQCHVHTALSHEQHWVTRIILNVELWMSLWRTWQIYERFTFFVNAKEYRSKPDVTCIEKTNTNVDCNYCQANMITSSARQWTCFKRSLA